MAERQRRAFGEDRRRDRRLQLGGWEVVRFTWRDILTDPAELETTLARLLSGRGAQGRLAA